MCLVFSLLVISFFFYIIHFFQPFLIIKKTQNETQECKVACTGGMISLITKAGFYCLHLFFYLSSTFNH